MEYKINSKFGWSHGIWDATPIVVIGAKSAQHAVGIVAARGFFKSITTVQSRECLGFPWSDCDNWTQPTPEDISANAIVEVR